MDIRISYNDPEVQKFLNELSKEKPRGAAIMGYVYLDDLLTKIIKRTLVANKEFFEYVENRMPAIAKISLCYELGKISKIEKGDLEIINSIRNKFAHNIKMNSFKREIIAKKCNDLEIIKFLGKKTNFPIEYPRDKYQVAITLYQMFLRNALNSSARIKERQKPW